jgi:hypothetical protein
MKILFFILVLTMFQTMIFAQTKQIDMKVFGMTLGDTFDVPECKISIVELKSFGVRYFNYDYEMDRPDTGNCFKRQTFTKIVVKKKEHLPPLPPLNLDNEPVLIVWALDGSAPQITANAAVNAKIIKSKLTSVSFIINAAAADETVEKLKQKYGSAKSVTPYKKQNLYGAVLENYIAVRELPNLKITLISNDYERFGVLSKFGMVFIRPFDPNEKKIPKDKTPI